MALTRRNLLNQAASGAALGVLGTMGVKMAEAQTDQKDPRQTTFELHPVGTVQKKGAETILRIFDKYAGALKGLEGFSHVWVFWWFDRNDRPEKRGILQVHPRGDQKNPLTGVFACRSPVRPNLIALTLCKVRSVTGNAVEVEGIDAFDGTPILDLKPYIPSIDAPKDAPGLPDWLKRK
ncbi:MAG TPA: tRNA (N6-threonylcarbamoyladenosine(37)-N6)-methyltransferase TrmO [Phycisphaerae bacterium]|nr:tRNA (N6-threonylcarbamoyladenosine(37)-N6)-methyltransferase TrmO [Phycisphaerae bacterium]